MPDAPNEIQRLVDEIKKGWKRRVLLQGSALTLLMLLGAALVLMLAHLAFRLSPVLLTAGGVLAVLAVLAVAVQFLLRPYLRPLSDREIALYVEERIPELEDRLNSAIEVETLELPDQARSELIDRLLNDAARQAASIPTASVVDRQQMRRLACGAGVLLFLLLAGGYLALDDLRLASTQPAGTLRLDASAPLMTVSPGNAEVEQGSSQAVEVRLRERRGQAVTLYYRSGEGDWQKIELEQKRGEEAYVHEFSGVQQPIRYFAEAGEHRSDSYTISLYDFPDVRQIDLTYSYPSYTGLPPWTEENTGDIRGLKSANVTVQVATSGSVKSAELVVRGEKRLPLEAAGDGRFATSFPLQKPGSYYVHLTDEAGKENKFPIEYRIDPLPDERPVIELTAPRRDVHAHPLEEIQLAADVRDDYGLKSARIKYAVNGGKEQSIALLDRPSPPPLDTSGAYRFFLEKHQLEPGDVISYYVEAEDFAPQAAPQVTDMYFIEVIPFEQRFRQASNRGGGGRGQQQSSAVISQQQIITATWKLQRTRSEISESEFEASLEAIEQGQANLKSNIEERISNTAFSLELRSDEKSRQVVRFLREATTHMEAALDHLKSARLEDALTPEKKALSQLLKADALNKERQVALNRQRSGGGSSAATEDRMTELADLELDISEDKYETRQQRSSAPQDRQLNEALQKLKELSRKQEDLLRKGQQQMLRGVDKKRMVDQLRRNQGELQRQTEALSQALRRMARDSQQMSPRSEEQLQRASKNMRRAEQAMQRGDTQQAQSSQQQALNDLNRLESELQKRRSNSARATRQQLAQNFEKIKEEEEQLRRALEKAEGQDEGQQADEAGLRRMQSSRQEAIKRLRQLKEQMASLQEQRSQGQQGESAASAQKLAEELQREELARRMQASQQALKRGDLEEARQQQEQIASALQRLDKPIQQLSQGPASKEEQMARDLATLRELKEQLEEQKRQSGTAQQSSPRPSAAQGDRENHLRRQIEKARQSLQRLQPQLEGNPSAQRQASRLQQALRADRTGELLNDGAADDYFNKRVYKPLTELEMELARKLNALQMKRKIYGARRDDVPPAYRELVEKYYESLSK